MDLTSRLRCEVAERHSVCDLSVYDIKGHRGTDGLKSDDHVVVLMNNPGKLSVFWEGCRKLCDEVLSGDLIYSPAGSTISCEHHDVVDSAFIRLKQATFARATMGDIDHTMIDFSGRHVRQATTTALAGAALSVGMASTYHAWPMLVESATMALAVSIISALSPGASMAFREKPYGMGDVRYKRLVDFIDSNLHRPITLAEMAELCTMSQFHFSRLFKKRTGMTVMKFIGMRRVERSKKLLQSTGMSLAQIAHDCGFSSQSHFTGVFKLDTGTTPASYRNAVR